eukprot:SAG31_NODE_574_length_13967_cov_7.512042_15_plen_221_part_00
MQLHFNSMCSAGRSSRLIVWCVCASMAVARTYTKVTPYGRMMSSDRAALNMVSIDGYARKVQQQCADATYASGSSTETSATATDDAHDLNGEAAQTIDTADEIRLSNVVDSIATTVNDEAVHSDAVAEKRAGPPRAPVVETSGAQVNTVISYFLVFVPTIRDLRDFYREMQRTNRESVNHVGKLPQRNARRNSCRARSAPLQKVARCGLYHVWGEIGGAE